MWLEIDGVMVKGFFDEKFTPTVSVFASHIAKGQDVGASFALSIDGDMVVDVWAGCQDEAGEEATAGGNTPGSGILCG